MDDDAVSRALVDPSRRLLLDRLFERDGQTLVELAAGAAGHDPAGRHEAPAHPRGRRTSSSPDARSAEAPLPQPRADPADPRPLDQPLYRTPGRRPRPAEGASGGTDGTDSSTSTRSTSAPRPSGFGRRSPTRDQTARYYYGTAVHSDWQPGSPLELHLPGRHTRGRWQGAGHRSSRRVSMEFNAVWDDHSRKNHRFA